MPERHIVAIGGAGFLEPNGPPINRFIRELTGKERPRVLFLPTASGDSNEYIVSFYEGFPASKCEPSHLKLFMRKVDDLASVILAQDVIYVGGGNTANLLAVWRLQRVDTLIRQAWENGTVMCGSSAGSLCWFEGGITDSFGLGLSAMNDGLGILAGTNCPHYDSEARRRPVYTAAVTGGFPAGYATQDAVALHYVDRDLREVVSARPDGQAFRVEAVDGAARETPLKVRALSNYS